MSDWTHNLLAETLEIMGENGLTPADVKWVGSSDGSIGTSWDGFAEIAKDITYYAGHGSHEIVADLVVVFGEGRWLERGEYDGAEWWEYKECPILQSRHQVLTHVTKDGDYSPRLVPMKYA